MKRVTLITLLLSPAFSQAFGANDPTPITSIGSNPYFSTDLYPQDIMLRSGSYLFYCPDYQNKPYWGDIDEPANKPTNRTDYTVTGIDIKEGGGSFKHSGIIHSMGNNLGYAHQVNEKVMTSLDFDYNVDFLRNTAEGVFTTTNTAEFPEGGSVPFNYSLKHTMNQLSIRGMLGSTIGDVPFGIALEGGFVNTVLLDKEIAFSKPAQDANHQYIDDSIAYFSMEGDEAPAFLGWTTSPCSHIFGIPGPQGDSWSQGDYGIGPVYHFNFLGGLSLGKVKGGGFFRYKRGHQNLYSWKTTVPYANNDTVVSKYFFGQYLEKSNAKINKAAEGRLFGNIRWREGDRFALNTFAAIGYLDSTIGYAPTGNLRAESSNQDKLRAVELEFFPNINVKLGEFLNYVDGAVIFRYRYSRFSNTAGTGVYQGSQVGNTTDWDDPECSFANENAVDLGADFAAMFPLFTGGPRHLSLNLRLVGDVRFTAQHKHYGETDDIGRFTERNIRKNFNREVMFNTFLMLHYIQGPYHLRLQFTEPVLYSIAKSTSVTDADKHSVGTTLKKPALWITQNGLRVALYASYDMVMPFLPH